MDTTKTYTGLMSAIADFFDKTTWPTLTAMSQEIKALSAEDAAYFKAELQKVGYKFTN